MVPYATMSYVFQQHHVVFLLNVLVLPDDVTMEHPYCGTITYPTGHAELDRTHVE